MRITSYLIILFISSLFLGCAQTEEGQSEELAPYIASLKLEYFEATGEELKTNIPINIKDLGEGRRGICRKAKSAVNSVREIFIDRTQFDKRKNEKNFVTTVLLHEIGHCIYGLDHDVELMDVKSFKAPTSIMYESTISIVPLMEEMKDYYYKEFHQRVESQSI